MNFTLPVKFENGFSLDAGLAWEIGEYLAGEYIFADPYPHIVLDNFLPNDVAHLVLQNFPMQRLPNDVNYVGEYFEHNKRQVLPYACNPIALNAFLFFNSLPFLRFLEGLSRIDGLIPDPHFVGGGFHEISSGGKLGIHADFRIHTTMHLQRRLNVLLYLNQDWKAEYGGFLELWDREMTRKVRSIEPIFNRCVIFNTDADSFHGHPDPLNTPNGITRKSMALYFYTASKGIYQEIPLKNTEFQARNEYEAQELISRKIRSKG